MCLEVLQEHIGLNRSRFLNYEDVRNEIFSFLELKQVATLNKAPLDGDGGLKPMDIDGFDLKKTQCYKCGKMGHLGRDCPTNPFLGGKGKGKAKGKG